MAGVKSRPKESLSGFGSEDSTPTQSNSSVKISNLLDLLIRESSCSSLLNLRFAGFTGGILFGTEGLF